MTRSDVRGVPDLYTTLCKECNTNITNKPKHFVNLEPLYSSKKRYGFVCEECFPIR